MSEILDPFSLTIDAYQAAVLAKDIDAFLGLYDDEVHVFDMWDAWSVRGIAAWRAVVTDWFSSLGSERVMVGATEMQTTHLGNLAIGHAILRYTAVSQDGQALRSLSNRMTMALRRTGDDWKIFHEHTSAPIDHASTKALLR